MIIISRKRTLLLIIILILFSVIGVLYRSNVIGKILYPYPYKQTVEKYAEVYGLDPYLVIAVIREESRFKPKAISHKGALGLMQLMPNTAKEIAAWLGEDFGSIDLTKPDDNIRFGTWYLATLQKQFPGNTILILAAYNAGGGKVTTWLNDSPRDSNSYLIEEIPYKETREYVQKVLNSYGKYTALYHKE